MELLKFSAPWCGQCRVLTKNINGFNVCNLVEIDVEDDENEQIVGKYGIKGLPTLVLVDGDGNELKRWNGIVNVNDLKSEVEGFNNG